MPKKIAAPKSTDDFVKWVSDAVPEGTWVYAHVIYTSKRDGGRSATSYDVYLSVKRGGVEVSKTHHSFAVLGAWLRDVAIPTLCPPPQRPLRKLTIERPKLEHHPIERLFD